MNGATRGLFQCKMYDRRDVRGVSETFITMRTLEVLPSTVQDVIAVGKRKNDSKIHISLSICLEKEQVQSRSIANL